MRLSILTIVSSVVSLIILWLSATSKENGDTNASLMYLVVYAIPVLLVCAVNAICFHFIRKFKSSFFRMLGALTPIVILILFAFSTQNNGESKYIGLVFVSRIGAVTVGLTNLVWLVNDLQKRNQRVN